MMFKPGGYFSGAEFYTETDGLIFFLAESSENNILIVIKFGKDLQARQIQPLSEHHHAN